MFRQISLRATKVLQAVCILWSWKFEPGDEEFNKLVKLVHEDEDFMYVLAVERRALCFV
uniref:Uncharacterized protein n=1 Tax=Arundo donax TaxID=35708 RepID=A0A0A9PFE8_ARUDO